MALLEEVDEGAGGSADEAENLKAARRRKRANKNRRKKRAEGGSVSYAGVLQMLMAAGLVIGAGLWMRSRAMHRTTNLCKMTYSRPEYVPLPVAGYSHQEGDATGEVPGYGYRLVRFVDGKLPASDKRSPSKPTGTPVLFVPGHLGTYKQARSVGSLAAEARVSSPRRRLDVFTLDLQDEWTALHGSIVWRQAEFFNHAVQAILALYDDGDVSVSSVMIVGHSLGGIVARTAFALPSYRAGSISDIITLGAPHDRAPWMMDYSVLGLYKCVDSLWRRHFPAPRSSCSWPLSSDTVSSVVDTDTPSLDDIVEALPGITANDQSTDADDRKEACVSGEDDEAGGVLMEGGQDCDREIDVDNNDSVAVDSVTAKSAIGKAKRAGWGGDAAVDAETLLGNTVLLSISGGPKDMMVHPSLCVADDLGMEGQSVGYTTAAMEGCGFGVDHLALAWCKQVVTRVVATLSELEKLHSAGAGAKERTTVAARVMGSSSQRYSTTSARGNAQSPQSVGFEEAAEEGEGWQAVARSLVTDRSYLLIPMWMCLGCLALAAALVRGLTAKTDSEGTLLDIPLLLTPKIMFHFDAVKTGWKCLQNDIRARGRGVVIAAQIACAVVVVWVLSDHVAANFPAALERVRLFRVCGWAGVVVRPIWNAVDRLLSSLVLSLNPFKGAGEATRLPPVMGLVAVYLATAGSMMVFVYLVTLFGASGNWLRRTGRPVLKHLAAPLRYRSVVVAIACVAAVAAHVERFSSPPSFRPLTVHGELSLVLMALSISLYALLVSLALFPASSSAGSTHQRLVLVVYTPVAALLMGPQLAAVDIIRGRGGALSPFVSGSELAFVSLALVPILASVWLARQGRLGFASPPNIQKFLAELNAQMQEEMARANGGSFENGSGGTRGARRGDTATAAATLAATARERPHGHGACGKCLHADGGRGAVFVETDQERVAVGVGVTLGPGFRVVACDCPQREPAAPSGWCEFCRCVCSACGGCRAAVRAASRVSRARGSTSGHSGGPLADELAAASAVGLVSVAGLYLGLWAFGMRVMAAPCHGLWALGGVGLVLCGLRWGAQKDAARKIRVS